MFAAVCALCQSYVCCNVDMLVCLGGCVHCFQGGVVTGHPCVSSSAMRALCQSMGFASDMLVLCVLCHHSEGMTIEIAQATELNTQVELGLLRYYQRLPFNVA